MLHGPDLLQQGAGDRLQLRLELTPAGSELPEFVVVDADNEPVGRIEDGHAVLPEQPGLGIDLDWDLIDNCTVAESVGVLATVRPAKRSALKKGIR